MLRERRTFSRRPGDLGSNVNTVGAPAHAIASQLQRILTKIWKTTQVGAVSRIPLPGQYKKKPFEGIEGHLTVSPENRARALQLAKELNEINNGRYHDDGTPKSFDELEIETNALTDLLSSLAVNESAKDLPKEEKPVRCPKCKAVPKPHDPDDDEPIVTQAAPRHTDCH